MQINHGRVFIAVGAIFSIALFALPLSCLVGQYPVSLSELVSCLDGLFQNSSDAGQSPLEIIISQIRLSRGLIALICGGALALAGAILQGCLRNPLADPFTLGISAGAACGASLAIASFGAAPWLNHSQTVTGAALLGSFLGLFLSLSIGRSRSGLQRENLILAGIAVAAFLGALVALIKSLHEESVTSIVFWLMGSLQNTGWHSLPILLPTFIPGVAAALWGWRKLDALSLGDAEAGWLGVNANSCRLLLLAGASAMTAGCVAIAGVIGFIGLVVPHALRLIMGAAHGPLLLACFPAGGLSLLIADCVGRSILDGGQELPVGVVTALAGAPVFGWLIWKRS